MTFDFPTLLVGATLFTGVAWALDAMLLAPRRRRQAATLVADGKAEGSAEVTTALREPTLIEYCKSFFPVILAVLLLRSFLVEPFRIPSGSMMPTLLVGDFILVNKFAYGIRLPVLDTKIIEIGEPRRGDVVVFRYPKDPSVDYIKREREHKRQALREKIQDKVEELDREGQAATWNRVDKALHLLERHQTLATKEELRKWVEEAKQ